ncbi:Tfp pilus assembly protein PilO [Serpentinimonas raichei]|uniref:Tfp pilus assembly protein PilO n=1 Tax=Serpentinimonas raichei TaxID=1458425 RepID=A0A060NHD5_9BURK|nr:type 4a pilus biogenesis protein PilO [Serpentinimonas raichei]BAO80125.1 Tfp pilus assembly protein PilO [Serpentinimonas raichei]
MSKKTKSAASFDFARWQQDARAQFSGLDPNDPSRWPALPRQLLLLVVALAVLVGLWYAVLSGMRTQLETERQRESQLRTEFTSKVAQAVNLDALRAQLEQVRQYVTQLERQLPSRAEMDALLSDINQAGIGRGLQFELFRPGQVELRDHYAELPIAVRVSGSYHDIGMFVSDVAHLSRIVTLNNLSLAPAANRPDMLTLDTTAKTFRYLDPEEVLQRQREQQQQQQAARGQR